MTKNNIKAILFASLMVAMILPFSAMNMVDAAANENANQIADTEKATDLVPEPIEKDNGKTINSINVQEFSDSKINDYRTIATKDPTVKSLLGENYEYKDISYRLDPIITVFELTYETEDSRVSVVFEDGKVVNVEKYPIPEPWY